MRDLKQKIFLLIVFLIWFVPLSGQEKSLDLKGLEADIEDGYLDNYSKIETAFILSGVTDADSMQKYLNWYDNLLKDVRNLPLKLDKPVESAQTVFMYIHATWLKTYALESTTVADIVRNKEYNCVAATILYNILCEDLNWSSRAFETPTHVYTIFENFGQNLIVENTSSMGFNILSNLKSYSRYLAKYYPQSDVLKIGLDRLYYHENSKGREITNTELLGLLAYNRAYLAKKKKDYKAAYEYVLLAQLFNQDSRSNINFELSLYYAWGKKLFEDKQFNEAFTVFADAFYRYPENDDFLNNMFASFFNAQQLNWRDKSWQRSRQLFYEMDALQVLQKKDLKQLEYIFNNWNRYFISTKDSDKQKECTKILNNLKK